MSDIQDKSVNELISTCSSCKNKWIQPKVLPCLHIYCQDCISQHEEKSGDKKTINCPKCSKSFPVSICSEEIGRDVDGVSLDQSVSEIGKIIQKHSISCTSCRSGDKPARFACSNCGDFLCEDCEWSHKQLRLTREHKLIPLEDLSDTEKLSDFQKVRYAICQRHGQTANLFCKDDKSELCHICTYEPEHSGHKITTIDSQLQDMDRAIQEKRNDLKTMVEALTDQKEITSNVICSIAKTEKESLDRFSSRMSEVSDMITKCEKEVTDKMKMTSQTQQQGLRNRISRIDEELEKLTDMQTKSTLVELLPVSKALEVSQALIETSHQPLSIQFVSEEDLLKDFPGVKDILPSFGNTNACHLPDNSCTDYEVCNECYTKSNTAC